MFAIRSGRGVNEDKSESLVATDAASMLFVRAAATFRVSYSSIFFHAGGYRSNEALRHLHQTQVCQFDIGHFIHRDP